ncbi:hypothetical protein RJ640_006698 [Escallonia rubra]|uniref:Pentatricopeptide repeat-containing protein n=1 Tax=Escallonia rubra TaxID=112253 RepID=A0AA88R5M3_9ASTE|nr:hypothetical protein RJ640_006698 [Escallonia rubra]
MRLSFTRNRPFTATATKPSLGNFLLVASIVKSLSSTGGTRNLDPDTTPITESLVLQILRRNSLDVTKKVDFFRWCSLRHDYKHSARTYSQVFKTICHHFKHHHLQDILDLLASMKQDGVVLDPLTFKMLLDAFIKSGEFDSALEILDHVENELDLGEHTNYLMPDLYNSVLVALVRNEQLGLALTIFFKLLDSSSGERNGEVNGGVFPNAVACNEVLVALRKAGMKDEFKRVFDKLKEKGVFPLDTYGYNICIHAFGCWGELGVSLSLFKEMKEKGCPDLCTYNSLVLVLCLAGKVKDALIVWEELKGSGHEPDEITYGILIHGCSKTYRTDDATKIFSEMQYNGFRPSTNVFNFLLDGYLKARKLNEACQLFEKMVDDGVWASCWTYNILIDGLFRNGRPAAAYALFCDLKKKGQFVDGITYSIVTLQFCREGRLEEAIQLVEEMEARGFVVGLVTITSLVIAHYRHGRWEGIERLMKHIRDGNLMPTVLKWKATMESSMKNPQSRSKDFTPMFAAEGDFSEVLRLINSADRRSDTSVDTEVVEPDKKDSLSGDTDQWSSSPYMDHLANQVGLDNHSFLPFSLSRGKRVQEKGTNSFDIDMVNTYLSIFLAKGKLSLACKLFEIFTDMGVDPVGYTYNSMMSSFVKKGYFNEAWGVLNEMGDNTCPTDIATYNVIIQGLGKMGRADLARAVLDKLLEQGGYLDIVMYNTLINALGKVGRTDEATKLFQQMRSSGINPDVVTYNTLIEVHSKAGRLKDAYKFLKLMLNAGCPPNHVTDTTLDFLEEEIEKVRYQKASMKRANSDKYS